MASTFPADTIIDQGRDWFLTVYWQDSTGTPINLFGYEAEFCIRENYNKPVLITLSTTNGNITLVDANGEINIHLPHAQNTLAEGVYVAELVMTSNGLIETSLLKGPIGIKNKVVP